VAVASVKLVVVCPGGAVTGGPEALHQLVSVANEVEPGSAAIAYFPFGSVPAAYERYRCPVVGIDQVASGALVVLPEIWPEYAKLFPSNRCALWWLSVDNFGSHGQRDKSLIHLHLCQSHYAWGHLIEAHDNIVMMLSDWVELPECDVERKARVVVNPAKDAGWLRPFISAHPDVEFVQLSGLDCAGVARAFRSSQLFLDFGRQPGKDRPPREAALGGCVVAALRSGAANFRMDMPIDDYYKFSSLEEASSIMRTVLNQYKVHWSAQSWYRDRVADERRIFTNEVRALFARVS
jgi:hypothetical protein